MPKESPLPGDMKPFASGQSPECTLKKSSPASAASSVPLEKLPGFHAAQASSPASLLLAAIVEASNDAIISKTLDGIILSWNTAAEQMFGYTAEEIIGKPKALLFPPDRLHEEEMILQRVRQGIATEHIESVRIRKDGTPVHVSVTISPIRDPSGTIVAASTIARDITERKVLQAQLEEAYRLESLGRLAGGIAHDFNNILTAIIGYTQMAQMHSAPGSQTVNYLNNVFTAAQRAAALTQQLLMYARRQMVDFAPTDINRVVKDLRPLLEGVIGEYCRMEFTLHPALWKANANVPQLEQVIVNLVANARDALPEGGRILIETQNVTLDTEYAASHLDADPGEYVMLAVSDNGVGMEQEVKEHIFEPFFTTKPMGKGTGLGLATCYGIVKQAGGNIWVYSEPGRGTTFKIYLPRIKAPTVIETTEPDEVLPEGTETVLLVDDEPMVRDIAARILREQGYQVIEATNGADALQVQNKFSGRIDLLVTDVVMPLMGGRELSERLMKFHPEMKTLYVSGYTHNVILTQGVLKEGFVLLTKPFTAKTLAQKVRELLDMEEAPSLSRPESA